MEIIVIGAGPAGLMAAIQAAGKGAKVRLLEQNDKIGKKLLATGNGKCNLSNKDRDLKHYLSHDKDGVSGVFAGFSFEKTWAFFEDLGIVLKDRDGWLYPMSEQALSVLYLLEKRARELKVSIKTREEVTEVLKEGQGFLVKTQTWTYRADRVIMTTGGEASAIEGSSRKGMDLAVSLGHTLYEPLPALVPLKIKEQALCKWAGTRMDAAISLLIDGKKEMEESGELQFADYGISGIPIFQISARAVRALADGRQVKVILDLLPSFSKEELFNLLEDRERKLHVSSDQELFTGLLPDRMIRALTAKKRQSISYYTDRLKSLEVTVTKAHSFERAQVVSGGISLKNVDTKTMESKKIPGLYLAGEILDVCGQCGGYNLQWAFSTGALAGMAAGQEEK